MEGGVISGSPEERGKRKECVPRKRENRSEMKERHREKKKGRGLAVEAVAKKKRGIFGRRRRNTEIERHERGKGKPHALFTLCRGMKEEEDV